MISIAHFVVYILIAIISAYRCLVIDTGSKPLVRIGFVGLMGSAAVVALMPFANLYPNIFGVYSTVCTLPGLIPAIFMLIVLITTNRVWANGCPYLKKNSKR